MSMEKLVEARVTPDVRNTGYETHGMVYDQYRIHIENPYDPDSSVKPEACDIQVLEWHRNDDSRYQDIPPDKKRQFICLNGINTGAHEPLYFANALRPYADRIFSLSHPDSPQNAPLYPHDTPFNDQGSFANSAYALLRVIERLYEEGKLDPKLPLTVVGFSGGSAVLLAVIERDAKEALDLKRKRYIQNAGLFSPGGFVNMEEYKGLLFEEGLDWSKVKQLIASDAVQYFTLDFIRDLVRQFRFELHQEIDAIPDDLKLKKWYMKRFGAISKLADVMSEKMSVGEQSMNDIRNSLFSRSRYAKDRDQIKEWPDTEPWKKIRQLHTYFSKLEMLLGIFSESQLMRRFHEMWPFPDYGPHVAPETEAYKRSIANIGLPVALESARRVSGVNIRLYVGKSDHLAPVIQAFPSEDHLVRQFENNSSTTAVYFRGNHLTTKANAPMFIADMIRHFDKFEVRDQISVTL